MISHDPEVRVGDLPIYADHLVLRHLADRHGHHLSPQVEPQDDLTRRVVETNAQALHELLHRFQTDHGHWDRETVAWWGSCGHSIAVSTNLWQANRSDVEYSLARIARTHLSICAGNGVTSSDPDQGPRDDEDPAPTALPEAAGARPAD